MKLKDIRRKKTVMALTAMIVAAVVWIMVWSLHVPFSNSALESSLAWVIFVLPIFVVTALGVFMGKDFGEKLKLILLGLIVGVIIAFITILCLVYNEIPVSPDKFPKP